MGLMDRIKKVTNTSDDVYDDEYYTEFDNYDDGEINDQSVAGGPSVGGGASMNSQQTNQGQSYGGSYQQPQTNGNISLSGTALEMKVVRPENFDSVAQIADHLLNNRTVVLNLENTNKETARRLIDFLSGVAYSIDGSLKKIASSAYVITPNNVDVGDAKLTQQSRVAKEQQPKAEETTPDSFTEF